VVVLGHKNVNREGMEVSKLKNHALGCKLLAAISYDHLHVYDNNHFMKSVLIPVLVSQEHIYDKHMETVQHLVNNSEPSRLPIACSDVMLSWVLCCSSIT
jgi:hypothetical protein